MMSPRRASESRSIGVSSRSPGGVAGIADRRQDEIRRHVEPERAHARPVRIRTAQPAQAAHGVLRRRRAHVAVIEGAAGGLKRFAACGTQTSQRRATVKGKDADLVTNDDGILAPGIASARGRISCRAHRRDRARESGQNGAAQDHVHGAADHAARDGRQQAVERRRQPADCVKKLAVSQLCEQRPDLVVQASTRARTAASAAIYSIGCGRGRVHRHPVIAIQYVGRARLRAAVRPPRRRARDRGRHQPGMVLNNIPRPRPRREPKGVRSCRRARVRGPTPTTAGRDPCAGLLSG